MDFDALILAGGSARRLGGQDKAEIVVGGLRLLDRALASVCDASRVVVVGTPRPTSAEVVWTFEEPPGGGPVAALAAGLLEAVEDLVVVLAVDLPFVDRGVVARLVEAVGEADVAMLCDDEGRDQPLAAAYRTDALRRALARLGDVRDAPVHSVVADMDVARLKDAAAARDCDTWEDVEAARARAETLR